MIYRQKTAVSYKSQITALSILTLLSAFGCTMLGYLFLPLAAGFYAALLITEGNNRRIFSVIIPIVAFAVNLIFNGFYSLEAVSYVLVALIICRGFNKSRTKASVAFYATLVLVALMLLSAVVVAFESLGSPNFSAIGDFYLDAYEVGKKNFVTVFTSYRYTDESGAIFQQINSGDAVAMYNTMIVSLVPLSIIFAFISVGLALKIFTSRIRNYNDDDIRLSHWKFVVPPIVGYFYIIVSVLSLFVSSGVGGMIVSFISSVFMIVYFYVGIVSSYKFVANRRGTLFAAILLVVPFFLFPAFALRIISFIGVFVNNSNYKKENNADISV